MTVASIDTPRAQKLVEQLWEDSIIPQLVDYIRIPNKSPMFDPEWASHGYMDDAVKLIAAWCEKNAPKGMTLEVVRLEGRTPLIYMEVPATDGSDDGDTVLLYGHLDKQPEMSGWAEDLGPWKPVRKGDLLYGRGGADDGYAAFASVAALKVLEDQGVGHKRCVIAIEACEESGSPDLPFYIDHLKERIGQVSLVVCLDSGCGNYDQLWSTTSLRGMSSFELRAETISEGVHSGDASGIVPSSFRVLRQLLSRVEDEETGRILLESLNAPIPEQRVMQAKAAAATLGSEVFSKFPFHEGAKPMSEDLAELILNRTWRPTLSVTGAAGLPELGNAGNVLRPMTALKLSFRFAPTTRATEAMEAIKSALLTDSPSGAKVSIHHMEGASGWNAPELATWLEKSLSRASNDYFGRDAMYMGEGGSIPFMGMLGDKFPEAQFVITGVLGPKSNAHGPNEFLHIPTGKRLTCCVAQVLRDHAER